MGWYYLNEKQEQTEFDPEKLGELIENGTLQADTYVWEDSMSEWQPLKKVAPDWFEQKPSRPAAKTAAPATVARRKPALNAPATGGGRTGVTARRAPGGAPAARKSQSSAGGGELNPQVVTESVVKGVATNLSASSGWMKFVAILMIIGGVSACLTIVGAIWGWLPIWMGVCVLKAAGEAQTAEATGSEASLAESLRRVALAFKIWGIAMLVVLVLNVLSIVAIFVMGGLGAILGGLQVQQSSGGWESLQEVEEDVSSDFEAVPANPGETEMTEDSEEVQPPGETDPGANGSEPDSPAEGNGAGQ